MLLLVSCGGGGGGGNPPTIPSPVPGPTITAPTVTFTVAPAGANAVDPRLPISASFSNTMAEATINGQTFTLTGPGSIALSGRVSYVGLTATFVPDALLPPGALITATISHEVTDANGIGLSGNQATFPSGGDYIWQFTTAGNPDTTPPTVTATVNPNGATDVARNTRIGAFFSEPMDPASVSVANFGVSDGVNQIPGVISYRGLALIFTPNDLLQANTRYTVTVARDATDLSGNRLSGNSAPFPEASNYVWSFTTSAASESILPFVTQTEPDFNGLGVATNASLIMTFSEAMDASTFDLGSVNLSYVGGNGVTNVPGKVAYLRKSATFNPDAELLPNTEYTVVISKNVTDLAGNGLSGNLGIALPNDYVWRFTTGDLRDQTPPTISATNPRDGAPNVALDQPINATFSEAMAQLSINSASFTLRQGPNRIAGSVTVQGRTASFEPGVPLQAGLLYTATISHTVTDLAGNPLAGNQGAGSSDYVWQFFAASR
jgi:hypothetical protein